jgi:hypothetical protein
MSRKSALLTCALFALALASGPAARADYFYNFSPVDNPTVLSDHSGMGIVVNNQPQVGPIATGLNTNVVAATLSTFINPGITGTDTFSTGQTSTVKLTIIDGTQNGSTTFGLKFSGTLSANNSQIGVTFDNGMTSETKSLTVNGNQYSVTINSIVPPGVPGAPPGTVGGAPGAIPGSIGGQILAGIQVGPGPGGGGPGPGTGGGPPSSAPEPSTLVLSALGATLFGVGGWRKWRRGRPVVA